MKTYIHVYKQMKPTWVVEIPGEKLPDELAEKLQEGGSMNLDIDQPDGESKSVPAKIISKDFDIEDGQVVRVITANVLDA